MPTDTYTTTRLYRIFMGMAVLVGIIESGDALADRGTLRGLEGVRVLVEVLEAEVEQAELTRQQLQTDVERWLRLAGIRVLTDEEERRTPGNPYLYINVNVMLRFEGLVAYNVDVRLKQRATLTTDGLLATVGTWSTSFIGAVNRACLGSIRNELRDSVDEFINAYWSVHPRPDAVERHLPHLQDLHSDNSK